MLDHRLLYVRLGLVGLARLGAAATPGIEAFDRFIAGGSAGSMVVVRLFFWHTRINGRSGVWFWAPTAIDRARRNSECSVGAPPLVRRCLKHCGPASHQGEAHDDPGNVISDEAAV